MQNQKKTQSSGDCMDAMKKRFKKLVPDDAQKKVRRFGRFFGKPLMYVAAHILGNDEKQDSKMRKTNEQAVAGLEKDFTVFLPQRDNPYGVMKEDSQGFEMAILDAEMIRRARIVFAVGGFGKDTSWECGFGTDRDKLQILVLPDKETVEYHAGDWMLLLGFNYVFVPHGMAKLLEKAPAKVPDLRLEEFESADDIAEKVGRIYLQGCGFFDRTFTWLKKKISN